jgi:hypothetical protein
MTTTKTIKTRSMSKQLSPILSRSLSIYDIFEIEVLILEIFEFLAFKDIYTLMTKLISKRVTALLHNFRRINILKIQLKKHLSTFTRKFGLHRHKLIGYLRPIGAVIAGGFALAVFTGELYETSDMDIYIPCKTIEIFDKKIRKKGFRSFLKRCGYIETVNMVSHMAGYTTKYYDFINPHIGRKIQIISKFTHLRAGQYGAHDYGPFSTRPPKVPSIATSVLKSFDITPVMCSIETSKWQIIRFNCMHLPDVLHKRIRLNTHSPQLEDIQTFKLRVFPRLLKYKTRGFNICDSTNNIIPRITDEFEKYEQDDIKKIMKSRFL